MSLDHANFARRIEEDHKDFRDVYGGRIRKALKKFIKNGSIFRTRGDGRKINITIPRIDIPHIVYGDNDEGIGRGEGKEGDVIGKDDPKGKGKGKNGASEGEGEGITIAIDMEDVFNFLGNELKLPALKPKPNQTFEDIKIKYNDISLQGPESLRHNRRTMLQALKRMAADGSLNKLHKIPGYADPMKLITPINSDRRYRQFKELVIPSSNAVIFFARDGSGSMDQFKCDVVSDMAWWIDVWVRRFYKRVECCYIWHDTVAEETDQHKFYRLRYGGGTKCSSALSYIEQQFESRFPPSKWNIYVIYFSDGDNYGDDNAKFNKIIKDKFPPNIVNFVGITQILSWNYQNSLKESVDKSNHADNVRTASIGAENVPDMSARAAGHFYGGAAQLSEDERNEQIKRAIIHLLGSGQPQPVGAPAGVAEPDDD